MENELFDAVARFERDPWGFVLFCFDWGHGDLEGKFPEQWQQDTLKSIRDKLHAVDRNSGQWYCVIREAMSAGNGVGKSALLAWIIIWALATKVDTRATVTANTGTQLSSKTWPTLRTWVRRAIVKDWFEVTATAMFAKDKEHSGTWRADAIPWSEHNPEAFAGLHNEGNRILVVFDESSAIADEIWKTTEGALTDANTEIIFLAAGNPTRTKGRFRECFTKYRRSWTPRHVDSRDVSFTNKQQIKTWEETEDPDWLRVHVYGQFPEQDVDSLIKLSLIEAAVDREVDEDGEKIYGVDVARMGSDESIICKKWGNKVKSLTPYRKKRNTELAGIVQAEADVDDPDRVNVDVIGVGAGVFDILDEQGVRGSSECNVAERAENPKRFRNLRAELYWKVREWFESEEASIPNDPLLIEELESIEYSFGSDGRIRIEEKDKMKAKIGRSPDRCDSLMLTFHRGDDSPQVFCF